MQFWGSDRIQFPHALPSSAMLGRTAHVLNGPDGTDIRSDEGMAGYRPD